MITRIGITAGDIWHLLDNKGPMMLSDIKKNLDSRPDIVIMSVGWLAREGHVRLEITGDDFRVSLMK